MATERKTNTSVVLKAIGDGISKYEMPDATGLTHKKINTAYHNLVKLHRIPPLTPAEHTRRRREATSYSRGGILLLLAPYAQMGMNGRETQFAILLDNGLNIEYKRIKDGLAKARARGGVRKLNDREKDPKPSHRPTLEELELKVGRWLFARDFARAIEEKHTDIPVERMDRVDWLEWIDVCNKYGFISDKEVKERIDSAKKNLR